MGEIINWNTPNEIFYWIDVIAVVGTVLLLTYATISAILYLTVQDLVLGTKSGDKIQAFTGIEGARDRSGMVKVITRFGVTLFLTAIVVTRTHIALLSGIYYMLLRLLG